MSQSEQGREEYGSRLRTEAVFCKCHRHQKGLAQLRIAYDDQVELPNMTRSERAREREVHRYYQTWLESSRGYLSPKNISRDDPLRYDANAPRHEATQRISRDKALVAFAQLGCLRLNVRRAIVTLIDFSTSFILAEATRTISLLSGGQHAEGDELWFGTASIPRSQGISEAALDPLLYTASSPDGQSHAGPALVMKDMTLDSRFSGREYVGNGATFYAGVPIVSKNGFTIGVYELTDDKPRHGLTVQELQFMQVSLHFHVDVYWETAVMSNPLLH